MPNHPWNNWFHCMANTYGTWLPGDERGWRSRNHRQHVDGDYKQPPPQNDSRLHRAAQSRMKREPVFLSLAARRTAVQVIATSLCNMGVQTLVASVSRAHLHVLARFVPCIEPSRRAAWLTWLRRGRIGNPPTAWPGFALAQDKWLQFGLNGAALVRYTQSGQVIGDPPRHFVGIAKKESSNALAIVGGAWADRGKILPIKSRAHQIEVVRYILKHQHQGAALWQDQSLLKHTQ
jgi:hypothetical protein